jgi:hypothetical protein
MIEKLDDMPAGTVGFRVSGDVTPEDYAEVLTPGLRAQLDAGGGLRTLYVIDDLDEIEPAALWSDSKLGYELGVRHHGDWVRSAIVTDIHWMARSAKLFLWMIPGEARVYPLAELDDAKAWVAG